MGIITSICRAMYKAFMSQLQGCSLSSKTRPHLRIKQQQLSIRGGSVTQDCEAATSRDPNEFAAWFDKGNIFVRLGAYKEALESYTKAADLAPGISGLVYISVTRRKQAELWKPPLKARFLQAFRSSSSIQEAPACETYMWQSKCHLQ